MACVCAAPYEGKDFRTVREERPPPFKIEFKMTTVLLKYFKQNFPAAPCLVFSYFISFDVA